MRGVELSHSRGQKRGQEGHAAQNPAQLKAAGADFDRLAAMLKAIPAGHRAEFLRGLAAMLDGQGLDSDTDPGDNE